MTPSPFYDSIPVDLGPVRSIADKALADAGSVAEAAAQTMTDTLTETADSATETVTATVAETAQAAASAVEAKPASPLITAEGPAFTELGLDGALLTALAKQGYEHPTPIQARCIPPALAGKDILGCAQTGTGKTAAFSLPLLHRLLTSEKRPLRAPTPPRPRGRKGRKGQGADRGDQRPTRALVLSPTRELADQIADSIATYGAGTGLRHCVIYGGVKQFRQVRALERGVDIIVATPGRLLDLMDQGHVDLSNIEMFVLDEADRMLDMGFINPIRQIAEAFPAKPQTLLFSATMPPPIEKLANTLLASPEKVEVDRVASAAPLIEQSLYLLDNAHKVTLLRHMLDDPGVARAVVFIRTKHGAENLAKKLEKSGVKAESIHGNKNQNQRTRALDSFRSGRSRVLVATDVAARGLDVDGITHVFNFHLPNEPEAYVHRIGRTGRAGMSGKAVAFCARDERGFLHAIERLTETRLDTSPLPEELGLPDEPPLIRRGDRKPVGEGQPGRPGKRSGGRSGNRSGGRPGGRSGGRAGGQGGGQAGGKPGKKKGPRTEHAQDGEHAEGKNRNRRRGGGPKGPNAQGGSKKKPHRKGPSKQGKRGGQG